MKKEDVIFSRKEFLNLDGHESTAGIVAYITKSKIWGNNKDEFDRDIDIVLDISDCNRKISLDLNLRGDEYGDDNTLYKLRALIDVLTDFQDALVREAKYQKRLLKKKKRRDAENGPKTNTEE